MFSTAQAMKITEETYPVAVACLDPYFAQQPEERSYGCYLIINELTPISESEDGPSVLVLDNQIFSANDFRQRYQFRVGERKGRFMAVTQFRSRDDIAREKLETQRKKAREERQARAPYQEKFVRT